MLNQSISMNGVKEARTNSRITAKGGSGMQRENVYDLERKRNV